MERKWWVNCRGTIRGWVYCGWCGSGLGGRVTRFEESKFVEHQGLKCCELRGHGVLQGGVGVVHMVERFLESGVLCFKG